MDNRYSLDWFIVHSDGKYSEESIPTLIQDLIVSLAYGKLAFTEKNIYELIESVQYVIRNLFPNITNDIYLEGSEIHIAKHLLAADRNIVYYIPYLISDLMVDRFYDLTYGPNYWNCLHFYFLFGRGGNALPSPSSYSSRSPTSQSRALQILSRCSRLTRSTSSLYSSLMVAALIPVARARSAWVQRLSPRRVDSRILIMLRSFRTV